MNAVDYLVIYVFWENSGGIGAAGTKTETNGAYGAALVEELSGGCAGEH